MHNRLHDSTQLSESESKLTIFKDLGSVGVDIVSLDHTVGSKNLRSLIISKGGLTADINHRLDTVGVSYQTTGSIEFFRSIQVSDAFVDMARTNGKDINGIITSQETTHVKVMDRHISEDTAASLDILKGWRCGVARAQLDLDSKNIE